MSTAKKRQPLPNEEKSLWRDSYPSEVQYPELTDEVTVDVAIVGAGITGLSSAYFLKKAGYTVAVVDKHSVGGGTTGRTTGKVTSQHNLYYANMKKRLGEKNAQNYADANQKALDAMEKIIKEEKIECDWQRDDNYVFTTDPRQIDEFEKEAEVSKQLGLPAEFTFDTPLPFDVLAAVKFKNQAKINAQKYLLGLAKVVDGNGSYIFEKSTIIGIREGNPGHIKSLKGKVLARHIIVASSVPTFPLLARAGYGILEYPSESYIVAGVPQKAVDGMYISPNHDKNYSILPIKVDGKQQLLIGGESHFYGLRGDRSARFERLADYAYQHFGVTEITHKWSDRDYLAYDDVPLVGKLYPWSKNLYVGTAFRKWGLTNCTAAGMILCDAIQGKSNPWAETYRSMRTKPITSFPRLFKK